jgi:hypothetical protein
LVDETEGWATEITTTQVDRQIVVIAKKNKKNAAIFKDEEQAVYSKRTAKHTALLRLVEKKEKRKKRGSLESSPFLPGPVLFRNSEMLREVYNTPDKKLGW